MSGLRFRTAVCRECKHEWDLDREYGKAEILKALSKLAHCPSCKGIRVSFPYAEGKAPVAPVAQPAAATPRVVAHDLDKLTAEDLDAAEAEAKAMEPAEGDDPLPF